MKMKNKNNTKTTTKVRSKGDKLEEGARRRKKRAEDGKQNKMEKRTYQCKSGEKNKKIRFTESMFDKYKRIKKIVKSIVGQ